LTVPWEFSLRKGRKKLEGGKTDNAAAPANEQFNNLLVTFQPLLLRSLGIRGGNKIKLASWLGTSALMSFVSERN